MMKILVCIKKVLADGSDVFIEDGKIEKSCLLYKPNPADVSAFYEALSIKEKYQGATLDVVTVDGCASEPCLRLFTGFGGDNAYRLWDDHVLCDQAELNNLQIAEILSAFARKQAYDVILLGGRSEYMGAGGLPILLGCKLGIPAITNVTKIDHADNKMSAHRMLGKGRRVVYQCSPKLILSIESGASTRLGDDIEKLVKAQEVAVNLVPFSQLEIDSSQIGKAVEKVEYAYPKPRTKYVMILESNSVQDRLGFLMGGGGAAKKDSGGIKEGSPVKIAEAICNALAEKNLLPARQ
jgi:electron transfer flavoprotein beta subunit